MNWNRAKTLLLAALIAANAFLGYRLYILHRSEGYVTESYAQQAAEALSAMGVDILPDRIPLKKPTEPIVIADGLDDEMEYFASKLSGSSGVEKTKYDDKTVYTGSDMTLTVYRDGYFEYALLREVSDETISARKSKSLVKTFLELSDLSNSDFEITEQNKNEKGYTFTVLRKINSLAVSDYTAQVRIEGGSVVSANGKLFAGITMKDMPTDFSDSINVLFALAKSGGKMQIENMQLMYIPSTNGSETIFIPMYDITTSVNSFRYDLSTGQIIN